MLPFLEHTAQHLWELQGEQLADFQLVFPNKRSALYFTKYLRKQVKKPFLLPECLTINEFFASHSDKVLADKLTLLSKLYLSYKKVVENTDEFSEFYPFANLLLGDFDAIDKHLIKTEQLFKNIADLQAIDTKLSYLTEEQLIAIQQFWKSFDVTKHSIQQELFLKMWEALPEVYENFNITLEKEGLAYEGHIFREVAEALVNEEILSLASSCVFIGFNVLNKAEKTVFRWLQKHGKASFYWDYDTYFTENTSNEAGRFIKENIIAFPSPPSFIQEPKILSEKEVTHISCSTEVQQTKVLGELLSKQSEDQLSNTIVVLANEELLPTVLSSLPDSLKSVNISMGYPLKETPWMQFLELIVQLHKTTVWKEGIAYFSSDIVEKLLQHPYVTYVEERVVTALQDQIYGHNKTQIAAGTVKGKLQRVLSPILKEQNGYDYLKSLLTFLFSKSKGNSPDRELMLRTGILAQRIHDTLERLNSQTPEFFWTLLLQELMQERMPFQLPKERGVQFIGFLESRLLDFENVYILSANENYLPNIQLAGSLIPYNLRIAVGLPTIDEQNAMYAYYFYRLLSRTQKMTLFSVSGSETTQCKEQSRYITQLQLEAPFTVKEITAAATIEWIPSSPKEIHKEEEATKEFQRFFSAERTLSASAINRYLRCPQNFYYRYIRGIQEVKTLSKAGDSNTFGSIFHKAAELLYAPYIGEFVSDKLLQKIGVKAHLERLILEAFRQEFYANEDRALRGKELLIFDTLAHFLQRLIERDSLHAPFRILGLEAQMQASLPIIVDGKSQQIVLKGLIDRIDEKNGEIRVVDYKTGFVNRNFLSLEALFVACGKYRNPTALQTFFYSWLYYKNIGQLPTPCVYHLRELNTELESEFKFGEPFKKEAFVFSKQWQEYENLLKSLLEQIFDNEIPFSPTGNFEECPHDAHSGICTVFGGN